MGTVLQDYTVQRIDEYHLHSLFTTISVTSLTMPSFDCHSPNNVSSETATIFNPWLGWNNYQPVAS